MMCHGVRHLGRLVVHDETVASERAEQTPVHSRQAETPKDLQRGV